MEWLILLTCEVKILLTKINTKSEVSLNCIPHARKSCLSAVSTCFSLGTVPFRGFCVFLKWRLKRVKASVRTTMPSKLSSFCDKSNRKVWISWPISWLRFGWSSWDHGSMYFCTIIKVKFLTSYSIVVLSVEVWWFLFLMEDKMNCEIQDGRTSLRGLAILETARHCPKEFMIFQRFSHCLKINQNVAFYFGIFHQFLTSLVTLFALKM